MVLKLIRRGFTRVFSRTFFAYVILPILLMLALILIMVLLVLVQCRTVGELTSRGTKTFQDCANKLGKLNKFLTEGEHKKFPLEGRG
jgi:ABC-type multidrug transport system fused ATPase/permease subunit